jgi:N-acetylmuramoyl-L-alanine amidase
LTIKRLLIASAVGALAIAAPASASVPHVVQPGETLWSIAAANGFTTRALAAANGLSQDSQVILGTTIKIPSVQEAAAALQSGSSVPAPGAPGHPLGSYVVRPGDTLTGIAAASGVPMQAVAAMNGVDPRGPLLIGTVLKLPTGAHVNPSTPAPSQRVVVNAPPYPTPERVSSDTVRQVAIEHGVPASLAAAIGWQESGFNNDLVSSANARGVMQILPGTWSWIDQNLASSSLNPSSAFDNVHAGVLYLEQLLRDTGGNIPEAVASYYQGLDSVRRIGMLPETKQYVDSVMSLRPRFGGPPPGSGY